MKTNAHLNALTSAIAEAKATLHDLHQADGAVEQLKKDTEPWTITTCEKTRVREILHDFKVLDVDIAWS